MTILLSIISILLSLLFLGNGIPYFFFYVSIGFYIFGTIFVLQGSISLYSLIQAWRRKGAGPNNILKYSSLVFVVIFVAILFMEIRPGAEFFSIIPISIALLVNWLCVRKVSSLRLNT